MDERENATPKARDPITDDPVEVAELYKGVVDAVFDAIVVHQDGIVQFANQVFLDLGGFKTADVIGRPVLDLVAPDMREFVRPQIYGTGLYRYEAVGVRRDGSRIDVEIVGRDCTVRGHPARVTAIRDISQRKRAEDALRRSEARFRQLIESTPDMVLVHKGTAIVYANPAAVAHLAVDGAEALVGRGMADLFASEDLPELLQRIRAVERTGLPAPMTTVRHRRLEGGEETIAFNEVTAAPIEFDGEPAVLSQWRDVTARKQVETRLLQADLLGSLGTLAAAMAHEINGPLTYVLVNLGMLDRKVAAMGETLTAMNQSPPARETVGTLARQLDETVRLLTDARDGANRVAHIARDFKVFSRADSERRDRLSVTEVLDAAVKMASNELRHRSRLIRQYEEMPFVEANEARLGQVFLNIVINALQALPESESATNEIRLRVYSDQRGVVVEVKDNGSGIPRALLGRVFEPFFTTKPIGVGTGLGLAISRAIVRDLGGDIEIESTPPGTTCRVVLPGKGAPGAAVAEARRSDRPPVSVDQIRSRPRVLVVDDERLLVRAVTSELSEDFDVVGACSGEEALELVGRDRFDLVLCDLMMPSTDGIAVYEELERRAPELARRVLFMSGGAFTPRARQFIEAHPGRCLDKPFRAADVREAFAALLEGGAVAL